MITTDGPLGTSSVHGPIALALAAMIALATGLVQILANAPGWPFDSIVHFSSSLAVAAGLAWTLVQLALHRHLLRERKRWTLAFCAMAILGAVQFNRWIVGVDAASEDWMVYTPFWLATTALVYLALRRGPGQPIAIPLWWLGLVLQCTSIACDLAASEAMTAIGGWSELLAIECHVVALVVGIQDEFTDGLVVLLNSMRRAQEGWLDLGDKVRFAARCREVGLPAVPTLLESGADGIRWLVSRDELDRDLFCKPREGVSSLGNLIFRRIAPDRYLDPEGEGADLDTVIAWIDAYGRATPAIVQPRLRNHPEVAGLSEASLVTARILTCLDGDGRPVVTHAALRVLSGAVPGSTRIDTYTVPIELEGGRLGAMTGGRHAASSRRPRRTAPNGAVVEGRILRMWPEIQAVALEAHRTFKERIVVGWDIGLTDEGPVLLDGDADPGVMLARSTRPQDTDRGPLGPLLQHHLALLAKSHGVD
jgi:hypothetical protein